jgi:hypothetical protein
MQPESTGPESNGPESRSSQEMLDQAADMSDSPEKVTWLEATIRQAELEQNTEVAFEARDELIDAATWSGQAEKAMLAFAWCLNYFDSLAPEARDWWQSENLLWRYKWILASLENFPHITAERAEALFQDFETRLTQAGHGHRAVAHKRLNYALHRGDRLEAAKYFERWQSAPQDEMADCTACEANEVVSYHIFLEQHEQALKAAKPLLEKRLTCHSVPNTTYSNVLKPLLMLGRLEEAARYHKLGIRVSGDADYLQASANHLEFLALTGNFGPAKRLIEKNLRLALETRELKSRFEFLGATLTWLLCLERAGFDQVNLNLTTSIPLPTIENPRLQKSKSYPITAFKQWIENESKVLATQFDASIGRAEFAGQLEQRRQVVKHAIDFPLPNKSESDKGEHKQ